VTTDESTQAVNAMRYDTLKDHLAKRLDRVKADQNPSGFTAGRAFELEMILAFISGMETPPDQS
jgi:hypothetical protein